jgi:hypothetical protein
MSYVFKDAYEKVLDAIENKVIDINDCIYDNVLKLINGVEDYAWVVEEMKQAFVAILATICGNNISYEKYVVAGHSISRTVVDGEIIF